MSFHESRTLPHPGWTKPIREMGVQIAGTPLEPVLKEFEAELDRVGIRRLKPRFYLSDEWGVPFGTTAIAMPFYLARADLLGLHAELTGFVEGAGRADLLRYLCHEMGHVVNYAYRLYEREDWVKQFGSIDQPYEEDYRSEPFSRRFVRHLPGWYAQKHPDEDWAETFAVWMTPVLDWRSEYADWPGALAKLNYCDSVLAELADRDPVVNDTSLDEDVGDLGYSLEEYYRHFQPTEAELPPGIDGSLRTIFEDLGEPEGSAAAPRLPASRLIRRLERKLMASVYRWTGHFPERTLALLRRLAERADELHQVYPEGREVEAALALTSFVTALAMNYVRHGRYAP